jgi:hypothetical protein
LEFREIAIYRAVCGTVTAVSDVWSVVFFKPATVRIAETIVCVKQTAFLIRRTRFQAN